MLTYSCHKGASRAPLCLHITSVYFSCSYFLIFVANCITILVYVVIVYQILVNEVV